MRLPRMLTAAACSLAVTTLLATPALAAPKSSSNPGYDVSYPQCSGGPLPSKPAFGIVGVSDGLAYGENPCVATEYAWAAKAPSPAFYMNTGNPGTQATRVSWYDQTGPQPCDASNEGGCAYDYGYNNAQQAYAYAEARTSSGAVAAAVWWLDVETSNSWSTDLALNMADVQGSIDFLDSVPTGGSGIYSTGYQWGQITGGAQLPASVLNWVAGASSATAARGFCSSSFTGGPVTLVQYPSGRFDADYAC